MPGGALSGRVRRVSVVIPARNEERLIATVVRAVLAQAPEPGGVEVLVVDDGSADATARRAAEAGARVLDAGRGGAPGNPAAARNLGARASEGDPIVFLDADCVPEAGWLEALLAAHGAGETVVGGSLDLPSGLARSARCDYYAGWYLVHSGRPPGPVPHHPPPNLSVRRDAFLSTSGFTEAEPYAYTNEERAWQAELHRGGHRIWFEPRARALHHNRPGYRDLLRRNYRWAYTSIPSKATTGSTRLPWLWRRPLLLLLAAFPLALAHTAFILGCWIRARVWEPLAMLPCILASRLAYAAGMTAGGLRWVRDGRPPQAGADLPRGAGSRSA